MKIAAQVRDVLWTAERVDLLVRKPSILPQCLIDVAHTAGANPRGSWRSWVEQQLSGKHTRYSE